MKNEGLDHLWLGSKGQKKSYDPSKDRITILSAQSSKGLEFDAVLLLGIGHLKDDPENLEAQTRAKQLLAMSASTPNALSDRLELLVHPAMDQPAA